MKRAALLLLSILVLAGSSDAAPKWARVDTPNFIIIGARGQSELRDVGRQFEGFREALTRVLSSAATATPVPTIVVVFSDDKSFDPFKPVYDGKKVAIGGWFMPRHDINYILLGPNRGLENLRPVFHEYTHLLVSNAAPKLPLWANEGLAEYYSTFEMSSNGRAFIFGRAVPGHSLELASNRWLPLDTLLKINNDSAEYNENSRRGVFYAESWMLMHMILHGEPDRRQAFAAYVRELMEGTPGEAAWQHQFGNEDLFKALQQYTQRLTIYMREYKLSDRIVRSPGVDVPLAPADVENTLGEVLLAMQRSEPAKEYFDRALSLQPSSARAAIGKARAVGTAPRLASPPDAGADWFTDYVIGAALIEHSDAADRASLDAARAALGRAVAARPDVPNVQVLFAMANERAQTDPTAVVEALKKAHAAAPVRDDYAIYLARALARAGEFASARSLLGGIMARPFLAGASDMARDAMREVVRAEQAARQGANPLETLPADRPGADPPSATERIQPSYREIRTGEQRTEGLLERIDCSPKRIEFTVRAGDRVAHFQVASFDAVDFISYRTDLQGSVNCGARTPPDRVYVTYRPGNLDGTAVAIEFLPLR